MPQSTGHSLFPWGADDDNKMQLLYNFLTVGHNDDGTNKGSGASVFPWPASMVVPYSPYFPVTAFAPTAGNMHAIRVTVPKSGTLRDFIVNVNTQSGNVCGAIYDTAATTRTRLWTSGSIACPATGWQSLGDPALSVTAGTDLDFAVGADNSTCKFMAVAGPTLGVMPANFWPGSGGSPVLVWRNGTFPAAATISDPSGLTGAQQAYFIAARIV